MSDETGLPKLETRVKLYHDVTDRRELLGFAEVVIAGAFVIKGIRILMGKPGPDKPGAPFLSFPARKGSGASAEKYFEVAHPITAQARSAVRDLVLKQYEEQVRQAGA